MCDVPQVAWAVPVVTVNTLQQPRACISLLMFDTYTRTRAYVPVILVSTMGLSDGWTDGTEHLVTITLRHSLRGQTQPRKPESDRVGFLQAHFSSCIYGSTRLLSSTFNSLHAGYALMNN